MKPLFILLIGIFFASLNASAQDLLDSMGKYTFVMLMKGDNRSHDSITVQKIQKEHLEYIGKMADEHNLNMAGPFLDDGFWRGILIFSTDDTAGVKALISEDPAVKAGRLTFEIHPWMAKKGTVLK